MVYCWNREKITFRGRVVHLNCIPGSITTNVKVDSNCYTHQAVTTLRLFADMFMTC